LPNLIKAARKDLLCIPLGDSEQRSILLGSATLLCI